MAAPARTAVVSAPSPRLGETLKREYESLFRSCAVVAARLAELDRAVQRLIRNRLRYAVTAESTGVPWQFVAVVHMLESGQDFRTHLHNGDPLRARTVRVPTGRPVGEPPFAWEASAIDALRLRKLHRVRDWSLPSLLYRFEAYNGFGYRLHHPAVLTPYLWAGSNHYVRGKYLRDGVWDAGAVSSQLGAAVLLRRLAELGQYAALSAEAGASPTVVPFRARMQRGHAMRIQARTLQRWLTTHAGVFLREDGWPGPRTAEAYRRVTGAVLPGDPAA